MKGKGQVEWRVIFFTKFSINSDLSDQWVNIFKNFAKEFTPPLVPYPSSKISDSGLCFYRSFLSDTIKNSLFNERNIVLC